MKHSFHTVDEKVYVFLPEKLEELYDGATPDGFAIYLGDGQENTEQDIISLRKQYPELRPIYEWLLKHYDEIIEQCRAYRVKEML